MQPLSHITDKMLNALRAEIGTAMSAYRFTHTLGVEEEAAEMAKWYLPKNIIEIRAAALLHDITKECTTDEQIALCKHYGLTVTDIDIASPKIFHAKTAAAVVADRYPAFASDEIVDAIAKHTTGAKEMSLFAKLLYLADYTEKTRKFADCVRLRAYFWAMPLSEMTEEERLVHLDKTLLMSYEMTMADLRAHNQPIAPETKEAYEALLQAYRTKN